MIMITSKAGQRLARAKSEYDEARLAYIHADLSEEQAASARLDKAEVEKDAASDDVADELIEQNFHLVEGD